MFIYPASAAKHNKRMWNNAPTQAQSNKDIFYRESFVFSWEKFTKPFLASSSSSSQSLPDSSLEPSSSPPESVHSRHSALQLSVHSAYNVTPRCLLLLFVVVVVVVVIAQQLISYRQLSMLKKSVIAAGLSHRSCTVSCVRWLWQMNRCSTECGATPHSRQTSTRDAGLVTVQKPTVTRTQLGESGMDRPRQQTFKWWDIR